MKNIVFVITKSQVGGAQKFVSDQIKYLSKESAFKIFLVTNEPGWLTFEVESLVTQVLIDKRIERMYSIAFLFKIIKFLRENNIELVICNSAYGGVYGRLGAFISNVKSIYVSHGWSSLYNGGAISFIFNMVEYILSLVGSAVLCVSDSDYKIARDIIGVSKSKLKVIYNAVPKRNIDYVDKQGKKVYDLLTVSRLEHPKRIDLIIDAIKNKTNVVLHIIGEGSYEKTLKSKALKEGISNVNFVGVVNGFESYFAYDIFVLLSESEGLPMSAIEAMGDGLPILISNVGGCPILINNNGVLVNNDVASVKKGVDEIINNIDSFSKKSLLHFDSKFNLDNTIYEYIHYYNEILNG